MSQRQIIGFAAVSRRRGLSAAALLVACAPLFIIGVSDADFDFAEIARQLDQSEIAFAILAAM